MENRLHLQSLIGRERKYQRCNYLAKEWQAALLQNRISSLEPAARNSPNCVISLRNPQSEISVVWRERICEWKYEVVDRFDIDREIVCYSTYYLDQYLSHCYVDEELFQLAAITCIYLAIKLHSPKKVGIQCIASMGRGIILPDHIAAMELSIMQTLDWHLHPPTPLSFIENSFPLISDNHQAYELSRFLSELSVCAYPFVCIKPSSVAIAATLIAIDHFQLGNETLESYHELLKEIHLDIFASSDVSRCCKLLRHLYHLAVPGNNQESAEDLDNIII
jgi:hypothetical protein